jgi:hypothetical protein
VTVIEYDQHLKSVFYPAVMYLEMITKNIVVNETVEGLADASFDTVYKEKMNDEQANSNLRLRRLKLRDKIHATLSRNYGSATNSHGTGNNQDIMISHFYNRGDDVPLWAIFEILSLGDFASFCSCLNKDTREIILKSIGLNSAYDTNSQLLANALYTVKGLRNSIAHNNVIFDCRFKDRANSNNVVQWLSHETAIANIDFKYLTDYLILICTILYKINSQIGIIDATLQGFEDCVNSAYQELPTNIYNMIVSTDSRRKLQSFRAYLI